MKRMTAVAWAFAMCGGACAQSNVTLYGTVDLYLNSAKSGPTSLTRLDGVRSIGVGVRHSF